MIVFPVFYWFTLANTCAQALMAHYKAVPGQTKPLSMFVAKAPPLLEGGQLPPSCY